MKTSKMAAQSPNGSPSTTIENKIATIEFGHPASNSFPRQLLDSLTEVINVSGNKEVSVIILRSQGTGALCGRFFDELWLSKPRKGNLFLRFCQFD
jgi:methylglutaconyl-CoA hydratase